MHGLILFCTLVAIGAHSTAFVKVKGRDEFDAAMESSRFVLALFSSKWCGRICHMAARAIQRAAKQLPSDLAPIYHQSGVDDLDALDEPDDALVLLKVDGGQRVNEEVLIREGVHDYPAIHFYIRGYKHVFNLHFRTAEFIYPWLLHTISHSPIQLDSGPRLEGFSCDGDTVGVIAIMADPRGHLWGMVNDLGMYADTRVYYVLDSNRTKDDGAFFCTSDGYTIPFPTLRPEDSLEEVKEAGRMFLDRHTLEKVTIFDPQRVHRYLSGGFPLVVFVLVETDLESARERLREFSTVPEGVSSIQIWEEWVPTMPELMKARDELRRSLWKRLLMDFEIEGLADILTVVVPRVASAEVGLWRATDGIDQLSSVSEAWELLHGVQVMFNQWFGLNPTSGASQVLTYDSFADTKHLSVTINEDDSLSSFVGDFIVAVVQEEVPPLVVSQSAQTAAEVANEVHPAIHALTAESISEFLSIPAAPMKLHLLLLYAPWCVHCLTFLWHVLHPLVEALSVTSTYRFFMMDATNNDVPSILSAHSEGYPSFFATDGEVLARYPMFDTSNMTKVIEWMEIIFNTVGVSESSQKDEL